MTRGIAVVVTALSVAACAGESDNDKGVGGTAGSGGAGGGGGSAGHVFDTCAYEGPSSDAEYPFTYVCQEYPDYPECALPSYFQPCDCFTVKCKLAPPD
jgi:hypothetical protein